MESTDCEVSSSSSAPDLLPPCRVCGDRATGFHYGANTCEACKGFFKRGVEKGGDYACFKDKQCEIHPGNKAWCPFCRFQKCLSVGMSLQKIRRGRYTLKNKTENIKEVKRLQLKQRVSKNDSEGMKHRVTELEELLRLCNHSYEPLKQYTETQLRDIPRQQKHFLENERIHVEKYGRVSLLDKETFRKVFDLTGIDIDSRRESIASHMPLFEDWLFKVVSFAKCLPGFKQLCSEDQIILVKAHRFYCQLFQSVKGANVDDGLYTSSTGLTMSKEELEKIIDVNWAQSFFDIAKVINRINPSDEETVILVAIAMFATDDCEGLNDPEKVNQTQNKYIDALHYVVEKDGHPDHQIRLAQLLMILTELRTYAPNKTIIEEVYMKYYRIELPPIMLEAMRS